METLKEIWSDKSYRSMVIAGLITLVILLAECIYGSIMIIRTNSEVEEEVQVDEAEKEVQAYEALENSIDINPEMNPEMVNDLLRKVGYFIVTATVYNPVVGQCDDNPLETADTSIIDLDKLNSGELKWIAVSRDLLGDFNYGDKVILISEDPEINGVYEIHDTMNKRFKNTIDILRPVGETLGKWSNVVIKKIEG